MSEMTFMPTLMDYLEEHSTIYTVRRYRYIDNSLASVRKVGIVKRVFVKELANKEELEPYVQESGFEKIEDWWEKIKHFIPTTAPKYLYKVEVVE